MPDYFVNVATGNDANPGTDIGQPLRTITAATFRAAEAGGTGTIGVAAGSYGVATGERFPIHVPPEYALRGAGRDLTTIRFAGVGSSLPSGIPFWGGIAIQVGSEVAGFTLEASPLPDGFRCNLTTGVEAVDARLRASGLRIHAPAAAIPADGLHTGLSLVRSGLAPPGLLTELDASEVEVRQCAEWGVFCAGVGHVRDCSVSDVMIVPDAEPDRRSGIGIDLTRGGEVERTNVARCPQGIFIRTQGDVRDCDLEDTHVVAGRVSDCDFIRTGVDVTLQGPSSHVRDCSFAQGWISVGIDLQPGDRGVPDRACVIAGNDVLAGAAGVSSGLDGIRIARGRNVVVEDNTLSGLAGCALLIEDSAAAIIRGNRIREPGGLAAMLIRVRTGARAAFERNTISNMMPDADLLGRAHYPVIYLDSLTALSDGRVVPGADFGGGPMGSAGGNRFGRLLNPVEAAIQVRVPGDSYFNDNFWWHPPGSTDVFPEGAVGRIAGAVIHVDGALADA